MKNIIFRLMLSLGVLAFAVGCDDDPEQIFEGVDNRIGAFSLTTTAGEVYHAAIVGEQIIVTVPENVSLTGAEAEYEISERAELYPDPKSVTDWDSEHRFRVLSYNQSPRDYTYTVNREAVDSRSVVLLTQADVTALAQNGVSEIEGDLIIGNYAAPGADPVTDLSVLDKLTKVSRHVIVNRSFAGEKILLPALRSAGGVVMGSLLGAVALEKPVTVEMPALESLGELSVNCPMVEQVLMPKLTAVSSLFVNSEALRGVNLENLTACTGNLCFNCGNNTTSTANKLLANLTLPLLEEVGGSLIVTNHSALSTLNLDALKSVGERFEVSLSALRYFRLPLLETIGSDFSCKSMFSLLILSFPKLAHCGSLNVESTARDTDLAQIELKELTRVDGDLIFNCKSSTPKLELSKLEHVGGDLKLQNFPELTELSMPCLKECGKSLYLYGLGLLKELDLSQLASLPSLQLVTCYVLERVKVQPTTLHDVELNGGSRECAIPVFEGAESIDGTLKVSNYTQTNNFEFAGLKQIGSYVHIRSKRGEGRLSFPDLERVETIDLGNVEWLGHFSAPKLVEVGQTFNLNNGLYLRTGAFEWPQLRRIGTLKLMGNMYGGYNDMKLESLADFALVEQITRVEIRGWSCLTDFSGLKKSFAGITPENWVIEKCAYVPSYDDMKAGRYTPNV